jgi:MFS transporter, OFA family, oxalate/formate antiporter
MSDRNAVASTHGLTRWIQLGLGLVCMMAISSPQYVWTLFTKPLGTALGVTPAALQVTFSLLIVLQTFFSPFQGALWTGSGRSGSSAWAGCCQACPGC